MKTLQKISELFGATHNNYLVEDNLPYHRFNAYDYEKLLNPSDDAQIIEFKNQNDEVLKFKLIKSTLGKKTFKTLNEKNYYQKHFCFDEQEIQFECLTLNEKLTFNLKKFPSKLNQFAGHSKFLATIQFRFWNNNNLIAIDYTKPSATLIINGTFYTKVRILEINNNQKIYFDQQKGIIGFDDLNGNIWRLNKI